MPRYRSEHKGRARKFLILFGVPIVGVITGALLLAAREIEVADLWSSLCVFLGPWLLGCVTILRGEAVDRRVLQELVRNRLPYFTLAATSPQPEVPGLECSLANVTQQIAAKVTLGDVCLFDQNARKWLRRAPGDSPTWSDSEPSGDAWRRTRDILGAGSSWTFVLPTNDVKLASNAVLTMKLSGGDLHDDEYVYAISSYFADGALQFDVRLESYGARRRSVDESR